MGNLLVLVAVMVIFLIDLFTKRWMERARWVVMSVEVPVEMLRDNEDTLETAGEMLRNVKFHPAHDAGGVSESPQVEARYTGLMIMIERWYHASTISVSFPQKAYTDSSWTAFQLLRYPAH